MSPAELENSYTVQIQDKLFNRDGLPERNTGNTSSGYYRIKQLTL
jgi:hypothetical protein